MVAAAAASPAVDASGRPKRSRDKPARYQPEPEQPEKPSGPPTAEQAQKNRMKRKKKMASKKAGGDAASALGKRKADEVEGGVKDDKPKVELLDAYEEEESDVDEIDEDDEEFVLETGGNRLLTDADDDMEMADDDDVKLPKEKIFQGIRKEYIYICTTEGCTNHVQNKGKCFKHGAKRYTCTVEGCNKFAQKGGVCIKHGGKRVCSHEGCTSMVVNNGVCVKHGAVVKICTHEGCTNQARSGEVCVKHGAKRRKRCTVEGELCCAYDMCLFVCCGLL